MKWPQIVTLVILVLFFWQGVNIEVKNKSHSSSRVTFGIFFHLAFWIGFSAVLYAGGFW